MHMLSELIKDMRSTQPNDLSAPYNFWIFLDSFAFLIKLNGVANRKQYEQTFNANRSTKNE